MADVAKVFLNGRSQAVRLPAAYRFDADEVFIRKNQETGEVILSARATDWGGFLAALEASDFPEDFLGPDDRAQGRQDRDPLDGLES